MHHLFAFLIAVVAPWCVLIGGLAGFWIGTDYLIDAYRSSKWPQTEGTVIRSALGSESEFVTSTDTHTRFWPEVEYAYEIDGADFRSDSIKLDGLRSSAHVGSGKEEAERVLAEYPVGKRVNVYYNPEEPNRATLQVGVSLPNFFVPSFGVVLFFLGLAWLGFLPGLQAKNPAAADPALDKEWSGKTRTCPECATAFQSIQNKSACPNCRHVFYASEAETLVED